MQSLEVSCATKDEDGDIMSVGNPDWGQHTRQQAVRNIKAGTHRYYVRQPNGSQVDIHVYREEFLRTDPDKYAANNLDNMVACPAKRNTLLGGAYYG